MTMEQTICHPWLLGDVSHRDEFHLSTAEEKGKATSPSSRDSSPSDIQFSSTAVRHNSLRLVVPNDLEELSLLLEERGGTSESSLSSFGYLCDLDTFALEPNLESVQLPP